MLVGEVLCDPREEQEALLAEGAARAEVWSGEEPICRHSVERWEKERSMEFSEPCFHEDLESTGVKGDPHSGLMLSHTIEMCT